MSQYDESGDILITPSDVTLPTPGSRWRIGETEVIINDTSKRGRGYQVHIRTESDPTPKTMRLKDFNKKAVALDG